MECTSEELQTNKKIEKERCEVNTNNKSIIN